MSGTTFSSSENSSDFLSSTINLSLELLSDILHVINTMIDLSPEHEIIWNRQITELTIDISRFVEVTTLVSKVIMKQKKTVLPGIKESHIHLLFILKAMNQAQHKLDMVALEDLIKYELKDNLTQWKIDLIPQTRRLLST